MSKVPGLFRALITAFYQIDYEIYNNILFRFGTFICMGTTKPKIENRKMYREGLFRKRISTDSRFNANDSQRTIRLSLNFSD